MEKFLTVRDIDKFKVDSYYFVIGGYDVYDEQENCIRKQQEYCIEKIDEDFIKSIKQYYEYLDYLRITHYKYFEVDSYDLYNDLKDICIKVDEWK